MNKKVYQLYCEICNWKRVTDGKAEDVKDLHELTLSPVPGGVPKLEGGKIVDRPSSKRQRQFRCPNCGRTVQAKVVQNPQAKIDAYREDLRRQELAKKWYDQDESFRQKYEAIKQSYSDEEDDDE